MSKRRTFTPEFKAQVVLEELSGIKDKAEMCREYRLRPQVFSRWREEFLERAPEIFATERGRGDEQERIAELEEASESSLLWGKLPLLFPFVCGKGIPDSF